MRARRIQAGIILVEKQKMGVGGGIFTCCCYVFNDAYKDNRSYYASLEEHLP